MTIAERARLLRRQPVRVPTNIVECAPEDVRVDMPVVAVFDDVSVEWTLVKFKPA